MKSRVVMGEVGGMGNEDARSVQGSVGFSLKPFVDHGSGN